MVGESIGCFCVGLEKVTKEFRFWKLGSFNFSGIVAAHSKHRYNFMYDF